MFDGFNTKINADIKLKEPKGGIRFGTDALLLADFALDSCKKGRAIDLGTGSGVIPLLMLASGCKCDFTGLELQEEYADIARQNSVENGFSDRFNVICGNAENYRSIFESGRADFVITNPPYMRMNCGKSNESLPLAIARREISGGASLFCETAAWALKSGGSFFAVYRPDRLANLICSMKNNGIEPKRLRAVFPSYDKKPSLVLIEGRKDGGEGLVYENNLYIYTDETHTVQTDEMQAIYRRFDGRNEEPR
ncbi:MAG: methyltransferase [Clostridia bacterium]|nr:methyltransferase [Clostridia bacterium]